MRIPGHVRLAMKHESAPTASPRVASKRYVGTCRECAAPFSAPRTTREFCSVSCRQTFNNRKLIRGAAMYDIIMAMRFDRAAAKDSGAWSLLCRLAASFKAEDHRDRGGRKSWDDLPRVRDRHTSLSSTVVGVNVAGVRRAKSGARQ
jgi:hypothetical protein